MSPPRDTDDDQIGSLRQWAVRLFGQRQPAQTDAPAKETGQRAAVAQPTEPAPAPVLVKTPRRRSAEEQATRVRGLQEARKADEEARWRAALVEASKHQEGQGANEREQRPLVLRSAGVLGLRRPVETGQVRQSFSHGRSKAVTVEVRNKRVIAPASAEPAPVVVRTQPTVAPVVEAAPRTVVIPRTLTAEEHAARVRSLQDARTSDEEARRRASFADAERRHEEEQAAERTDEEEARKRAEQQEKHRGALADDARRRSEEEAHRRAEEHEAQLAAEEARKHATEARARAAEQRKQEEQRRADQLAHQAATRNRAEFDAACQEFRVAVRPIIEWFCANEWGSQWTAAYEAHRKMVREQASIKYTRIPTHNGTIDWDISDLLEAIDILWLFLDRDLFKGGLDKSVLFFIRSARNRWAHARDSNNLWFTDENTFASLEAMIDVLQEMYASPWNIYVRLLALREGRSG